jgi:hypothetical protein
MIPIGFQSQAVQSAGGNGFSVRPALSLFLTALLTPHRSGQIPKTKPLYYALPYRRGKFTHCEIKVKTEWSLVLGGLPRTRFIYD